MLAWMFSSFDEELKSQCVFITVANRGSTPTGGCWAWSGSPAPKYMLGAWSVKQQPHKKKAFFLYPSLFEMWVRWTQWPLWVLLWTVLYYREYCKYSVVLLLFSRSSTFSHVACWCFCQYSVWPPGGAANSLHAERVEGLFAAAADHHK